VQPGEDAKGRIRCGIPLTSRRSSAEKKLAGSIKGDVKRKNLSRRDGRGFLGIEPSLGSAYRWRGRAGDCEDSVEPLGGTTLPVVARAAADAGIGWVVLNRDIDYATQIRQIRNVPVFSITSNHEEIGRIQGRQFTALLPNGGSVLYIEGPSTNSGVPQRAAGMYETKPANIWVRVLRGDFTTESAQHAVQAWLRLSTSTQTQIDLIGSQNDAMALGVRKAFQELPKTEQTRRWLSLPYTGVDGLPQGGQKWVREGLLTATVVSPTNTGLAIEMLIKAVQSNISPSGQTLTTPSSYPSLEVLAARGR